jgi:hypothetical protein
MLQKRCSAPQIFVENYQTLLPKVQRTEISFNFGFGAMHLAKILLLVFLQILRCAAPVHKFLNFVNMVIFIYRVKKGPLSINAFFEH